MSEGGNVVPRITKAEHIGPNDTGDNIEAKRVAGYVWNGSSWERESNTKIVATTPQAMKTTVVGAVTYLANAPAGTAQSSAAWRVMKIDETSGSIITWADGNTAYDNVATDLTILTYS